MFVWPAQRLNPVTVLRHAAIPCGIWPHRTWNRSFSQGNRGPNGIGFQSASDPEPAPANVVLTACGWQSNTAFIERLNLDLRQHVAAVSRRINTLCHEI
jgi:hypothetical protein